MELLPPVFAMVLLSCLVAGHLMQVNLKASRSGTVKLKQYRLFDGDLPNAIQSARQHYRNVFEMPILFYLLCVLIMQSGTTTQLDVILAWGYVAFRWLHSYTRISNHNVKSRFAMFAASANILFVAWVSFAIRAL